MTSFFKLFFLSWKHLINLKNFEPALGHATRESRTDQDIDIGEKNGKILSITLLFFPHFSNRERKKTNSNCPGKIKYTEEAHNLSAYTYRKINLRSEYL